MRLVISINGHTAERRSYRLLNTASVLEDSARCLGLGHGEGTGRCRTICGHQNHLPSNAAMDGVINDRTTSVSNSNPRPMVVPTWPITVSSLTAIVIIVKAKTSP